MISCYSYNYIPVFCTGLCIMCYDAYFYSCTYCDFGHYLLGNLCVSSCPTGYLAGGLLCVVDTNPFITLTLNDIQDQVTDSSSGIVFSTGPDTSFFPIGTSSDPIPSYQRGYYFTSTSYMTSSNFVMSHNFTLIFYIKQITAGTILSKNTLSIYTNSVVTFDMTSVIFATFPALTSTS